MFTLTPPLYSLRVFSSLSCPTQLWNVYGCASPCEVNVAVCMRGWMDEGQRRITICPEQIAPRGIQLPQNPSNAYLDKRSTTCYIGTSGCITPTTDNPSRRRESNMKHPTGEFELLHDSDLDITTPRRGEPAPTTDQLWLIGLPSCRARRSGEMLGYYQWARWHS